MRNRTIPATEFKTHCLKLLDEVAQGASITVTKRGKPVAQITKATERRRPLMGGMAGSSEELGDIVHFDTSELWEALR